MTEEERVLGDHQVPADDFPNGETEAWKENGLKVKKPGLLIPSLF